jgi:NAD(P)-dependent dehydrogenase (short-subunit alcohol dehydrogenase family)
MENPDAPERKNAETLGLGLFNESFDGWKDLYAINAFSVFFVTTAFLGLLAKGSEDVQGYWSNVVVITSISGVVKLAQNHVRSSILIEAMRLMESVPFSLPITARKQPRRI